MAEFHDDYEHEVYEDHSISEILNWYHCFSGANPPHNCDTQVEFQDVLVLVQQAKSYCETVFPNLPPFL
jgi:hypothetical protein